MFYRPSGQPPEDALAQLPSDESASDQNPSSSDAVVTPATIRQPAVKQ